MLKFMVHKSFVVKTFITCYAVALTNIQYSLAKRCIVVVQKSNSTSETGTREGEWYM